MSPMLFGQAEPEPSPEEAAPAHRRRYLVILGMAIVLILAAGSAAYLVLSSNVSVNRGPQGAPPGPLTGTTAPADSAGPATSAGTGASAGHSASPGGSASTGPGGGGPGAPGPVTYRVTGDLCPTLDLSPVVAVAAGPGQPGSDHTDKSNYVDYTCSGGFGPTGKVHLNADVRIYADAAAAQAAYATDKVGTDHVSGVGTDATGFFPAGGGYSLLAVDGNMEIKISLIGVGGSPTPAQLHQPAIDTVTRSLPRLRS